MHIHIVADSRHLLLVVFDPDVPAHRVIGPIPYDGVSTGNPYLRFGPVIREHLSCDPISQHLTVSRVTSGDLEGWIV